MRAGMFLMAGVVVSLMLAAPYYIRWFDRILTERGHGSIYARLFPDGIWHMHSVEVYGGVVSPAILLAALLGITALLMAAYKTLRVKERIHRTWACGYRTSAKTQYSATGFAGPIRRFFDWLYRPEERRLHAQSDAQPRRRGSFRYDVHVVPLFERSLYAPISRLANAISYWVYRLAHFEQTRNAAMIFNLMLTVLFGYRIFAHTFSWATFALESLVALFSIRILIIGDRR